MLQHNKLERSTLANIFILYYKTLQILNVQQIDMFYNKLVLYTVNHKHTNIDKHTACHGIFALQNRSVFIV